MTQESNYSLAQFSERTASAAPSPGGGSVAAAVGALAAALSAMVANLTLGKKGYEGVTAEMEQLLQQAEELRLGLLEDVERDCTSFQAFMEAMGMPKETEEEKLQRRAAMDAALILAAEVPLAAAERAAQIFPLARLAVESGNKNLVTDGIISGILAGAAVRSSLWNVRINLASIKDEEIAARLRTAIARLQQTAEEGEASVLALAPNWD